MISRRQFVHGSAMAIAGCSAGGGVRNSDPFPLGIASGDPTANSVVLWTRMFPALLDDGRRGEPVSLSWSIARDAGMRQVVSSGTVNAVPQNAYAVHVEATGLEADSAYFYQFRVDSHVSRVGRTHTLPLPGARIDRFTIGLLSCQEYSQGWFSAYRDLVEQRPDIVIFNGDYIYESASGNVRPDPIGHEAKTLEDYRALYAHYRQDEDLKDAHAEVPWFVIWDDHEVVNDWGPDHYLPSEWNDAVGPGAHRARVRAATKAFLEHMPLRASIEAQKHLRPTLYSRSVIGDLVEISHLDVRSYRDKPECNNAADLNFQNCDAVWSPGRSMLGRQQEEWLSETFGRSGCRWNCLSQATAMAAFDRAAGPAVRFETDSWDNYPVNRQRIVDLVKSRGIRNALSLGGNIHAYYAGVVSGDTGCSNPVMSEIVTTSVTAAGGGDERRNDVLGRLDENPCIRFFENRYRGYTHLDFSRDRVLATLRVVDSAESPAGRFRSLAQLIVEDGHVGVRVEDHAATE